MARHSVKQEADIRQCKMHFIKHMVVVVWTSPWHENQFRELYNLDIWIGNSIAWFASIPTKTSGKANY